MPLPYTEEELKQSVYYPASWVDFTPLLMFSDKSDFFIYVDWNQIHWSETNDEYIRKTHQQMKKKLDEIKEVEKSQANVQRMQKEPDDEFDRNFQPVTSKEYQRRMEMAINEAKANPIDRGLRGKIIEELDRLNQQEHCDLELVDDGHQIHLNELGINYEPQWPVNFALTPEEQARYKALSKDNNERWAHEFTIRNGKRRLKMLYLCAEGFAVYCKLFKSGEIAPKILILTTSFGPGAGGWADLSVIFNRMLNVCQKRPIIWP